MLARLLGIATPTAPPTHVGKNVRPLCYAKSIKLTKGQKMSEPIFIQEFINAHGALDKARYTNPIPRMAYVELAQYLAIYVGYGYGKNQIQKMIDQKTKSMLQELSDLSAKVGA
jgi:hypothetical protein